MRRKKRKENSKRNRKGVSEVVGVILMLVITIGLSVVVAAYAYGYADLLEQKPIPVFKVLKKDNTISVVLYDKGGAQEITHLLVQNPSITLGNLNSSEPTGEIEIGTILESKGMKVNEDFIVNATVDGINRIVIDQRI